VFEDLQKVPRHFQCGVGRHWAGSKMLKTRRIALLLNRSDGPTVKATLGGKDLSTSGGTVLGNMVPFGI